MKTVTAAYAKANLAELLNAVASGERIVISRYNKPVAQLIPSQETIKPAPQFGTGKGKVKILDPHCFDPMKDEEVDAFLKGRY